MQYNLIITVRPELCDILYVSQLIYSLQMVYTELRYLKIRNLYDGFNTTKCFVLSSFLSTRPSFGDIQSHYDQNRRSTV